MASRLTTPVTTSMMIIFHRNPRSTLPIHYCFIHFVGFLELGNLSLSSTYTFNDITYSIQQKDNSSTPRCFDHPLFLPGKVFLLWSSMCSAAIDRSATKDKRSELVVVSIQQRTFEHSAGGGSSLFTDRFRLHHLHQSPARETKTTDRPKPNKCHCFESSKRTPSQTENGRHTNIDLFAPRRHRESPLHSPKCLDLQNSKFNTLFCSFGSSNHI
ncbi:hypothetical protein V3C99_007626 [Haemonchus contortus]